jgi:dienelactone hydrolase
MFEFVCRIHDRLPTVGVQLNPVYESIDFWGSTLALQSKSVTLVLLLASNLLRITLMFRIFVALLCTASLLHAQPKGAPAVTEISKKTIRDYFEREVKQIETKSLAEYDTLEKWEKAKPELRKQLYEMLGLWPLPPRTDLKPTITGKYETEKFTVEKLHLQSMPGLYVTANLYIPKPAPKNAPTVLYVCGHGNVVEDKVSYGSKVFYQHHPTWLAEHGYVAMVIDTLQLGEIQGFHHGTYRMNEWWWQARGYTPAGVECWNGMRCIDYLSSRPEVDPKRIGVTGRSGGGAYSWWIAAADERVACAIPVAGIADLRSHLLEGYDGPNKEGIIRGHCDCMFMVNTYRWDFGQVAAMIAPRPVLLGNTDADDIFPVPGYQRVGNKAKQIYKLYGKEDHFQFLEKTGKHDDTGELRAGAFQWLNRWLKNDNSVVTDVDDKKRLIQPKDLKVFDRLPADERNTTIQKSFVTTAKDDLSKLNRDEWATAKIKELREHTFRQLREPLQVLGEQPSESPVRQNPLYTDGFASIRINLSSKTLKLWPGASESDLTQFRRRFALIGTTQETLNLQLILDTLTTLRHQPEFKKMELTLEVSNKDALLGIFCQIFANDPKLTLHLIDPEFDEYQVPVFLNLQRFITPWQTVFLNAKAGSRTIIEVRKTGENALIDQIRKVADQWKIPKEQLEIRVVKP